MLRRERGQLSQYLQRAAAKLHALSSAGASDEVWLDFIP